MDAQLVVTSPESLAEMIREVIREELDRRTHTGEVMTKEQLSEFTGWSLSTINRKMKDGLPYFGGGGEHPRFLRSAVQKWLTEKQTYL